MRSQKRLHIFAFACLMPVLFASEPATAKDWWMKYPAKDPVAMREAGNANYVRGRATFGYDDSYGCYYVGGGTPSKHGQPRYEHEGTFGVDYVPWYSRVVLNWSHGYRYQDGRGLYEPDHKNHPFKNSHMRGENLHFGQGH